MKSVAYRAGLTTTAFITLVLTASIAQEAPPPPTATPPPPSAEAHASAPTETAATPEAPAAPADPLAGWVSSRNPFLPIGYEAPLAVSDETLRRLQLQARATWPKFSYTPPTRLPSGDMVTIVKGYGIAEKGTIVRVERDGLLYRWKITDVTPKGIQATRLPLRAVRP